MLMAVARKLAATDSVRN